MTEEEKQKERIEKRIQTALEEIRNEEPEEGYDYEYNLSARQVRSAIYRDRQKERDEKKAKKIEKTEKTEIDPVAFYHDYNNNFNDLKAIATHYNITVVKAEILRQAGQKRVHDSTK